MLKKVESNIENQLKSGIQIVDSKSEKYTAGVIFFSELHYHREDFEKIIYKEIPEIAFQSLHF